jgi:hypothetical protein
LRFLENFSTDHVGPTLRFAVLAAITVAAYSVNFVLVSGDNRPPPWDFATYLSRSLEFYYALRGRSLSQFLNAYNDPFRPPLVPLAALPFYAIFGTSYMSAMLANLAFLVVLVGSTYKLGELVGSPAQGLVLAGIVATLPGMMTFGRVFGLDFPLACMVTASICLALGCEGFSRRRISVALGIMLGLGMLTKWTFVVFVAPFVAFEVFRHRGRLNVRNAFLTFALFLAISSTWYANALQQGLVGDLARVAWGTGSQRYAVPGSLLGAGSLLYYPSAILVVVGPVFGWGLIAVAILSSALLLKRRATHQMGAHIFTLGSLFFSLLFSLLVFTFVVNKGARFVLPAVPVLLLLLVFAAWRLGVRLGPIILIIIAISGSCISLAGALYPQLGVSVGVYRPSDIAGETYGYEYSWPDSRDWQIDQSLKFAASVNSYAWVAILADHWVFNQDTLKYYALRLGLSVPGGMTGLNFLDYRDYMMARTGGYEGLSTFDVVFMKSGSIGDPINTQGVRGILTRLSNPSDPFYLAWKMAKAFDLPDGSRLMIYIKVTVSPSSTSDSASSMSDLRESDLLGSHTLAPCELRLRPVSSNSFQKVPCRIEANDWLDTASVIPIGLMSE